MNRKNWFVWAILLLSAILFTSGVIKKIRIMNARAENEKVIAVIPKGTINMWWEVVRKGAEKAAQERQYRITWNGPELETDREKQIQAVEDAIIKGVKAIVLGPNDFKALARSVDKIRQAGLPCIIIDSPVDSENFDAFAGTDNYAGGACAAEILGQELNGKGTVILVKFVQNSASTDARAAGFVETLRKKYPAITIAAENYTMGTVEDARQKTVDMLTRFPDADGIFAVNHPTSVGAFKAIQNEKRVGKVRFVGFDSDPILLEGIADGGVSAVIAQNPFEIGYRGVHLAVDKLEGKTVPKDNPVPSMIVNKTNLEQMKRQFPEALGL